MKKVMLSFNVILLNLLAFATPSNPLSIDICYQDVPQTHQLYYEVNSQSVVASLVTIESDACASAVALATNGSVMDMGTTVGATDESGSGEAIPMGLTAPFNSVWYNITVPAGSPSLVFNFTLGTIVDPHISIYNNTCFAATPLYSEMVTTSGNQVAACLPPGTYKLQVASSTANAGTYTITATAGTTTAPSNDDCIGAGTVPLSVGPNTVDNICSVDGIVWFAYTITTGDHINATIPTPGFSITQIYLDDCSTIVTPTTCLSVGDIVHIGAGSATPSYGTFDINIAEVDNTVVNDDCADIAGNSLGTINCTGNTVTGMGNAMACPDPEATCTASATPGVWYGFSVDGLVNTFEISGTGNFQVFKGSCGSLVSIGCQGDASLDFIDPLAEGTPNYIVLVHDGGSFTANANPTAPINDQCSNAVSLMSGNLVTGNNSCAVGTTNSAFCNVGSSDDHLVGYSFTTPNTTFTYDVNISYTGSGGAFAATDLGVALFEGCGTMPLASDCNGSNLTYECLLPNTTYIVGVGSQDGGEGQFDLTVTITANTVVNDLCINPATITPGNCVFVAVSGDNADACPEAFATTCLAETVNTTWYSVTLPVGAIGVDIININNAAIQFFNDDCSDPAIGPTAISACGSPDGFFALTGGNTYLMSVSSAGSFNFDIRYTIPPTNDDCTSATNLTAGSAQSGTTSCGTNTTEDIASCATGTQSSVVWYEFMVTNDVKTLTLAINRTSGTGPVNVAAFDACSGGNYYNGDASNEACGSAISLDIDCPIAGTSIFFAVSTTQMDEGDFTIEITETQPIVPSNDDCSNAILSNGPICEVYQFGVDNTFACPEGFDIGGCGFDSEEVVWYQVDLPSDADNIDIGINSYGGSGTPFFGVFSDCTGTSIDGVCHTAISGGDPEANGANIDVSALAGSSIYVAFGSQNDDGGAHTMDIKINNPPANDDICTPEIVPGGGGTFTGTTVCAGPDASDANCPSNYENTVWYEYTLGAGETGVNVTVTGTTATGPIAAGILDLMGNCNNPSINVLTDLAIQDQISCDAGGMELKAACLIPGQVIQIVVGTPGANSGEFSIEIDPIVPNPTCIDNDECANAQDLGQLVTNDMCTPITDCNENACPEVLGTCNNGHPVNNVVWYQVQNDGDGDFISVEVTAATFDAPVVAIFVGSCGSLTQVGGCEVGSGGGAATGPVEIMPEGTTDPGENYFIAVGSDGPDGGDFTLCVEIIGGCANDSPCDAVELTEGVTVSSPASTVNCTMDETNPACPGTSLSTVWYKFTLPAGMSQIELNLTNVSITGEIGIMVGEYTSGNPACEDQPDPVFSDCTTSTTYTQTIECLKEDTEYYIQISTLDGTNEGAFTLDYTASPPPVPNDLCSNAQTDPAYTWEITAAEYCIETRFSGSTTNTCPDDIMIGSCDFTAGATAWYLITIPNDPNITEMELRLEDLTQGGGFFSVFENDCDPLTPLAGAECATSGTQLTDIALTPGSSYLVAVSTSNNTPGDFTLFIKVIAPPSNDLCENAWEIPVGSGLNGSTECATNSMDYNFSNCANSLNESDVWFRIPITPADGIITVDVTGWTGAGNYGATVYYSRNECSGMEQIEIGGELLEDCAGDKNFEIPVRCLPPSITHIYVKVGSPEDDGNAANGNEQGAFSVNVSSTQPSCTYADECVDVSVNLTPITDPTGAINYNACTPGCLDAACPQMDVSDCGFNMNPTVWFSVTVDNEAAQLYVNVTTSGTWDPVFAIYAGDCSDLTLIGGGVPGAVVPCNNDDTTPEVHNIGVQQDVSGNPILTYYIAVSGEGVIDDPNFTLCTAGAIGIIACLGGLPGDPFAFTCDPAGINAEFTVEEREFANGVIDPDGDGIPGPFCPSEEIKLCFEFEYDASATGQDWLQGIIPVLGENWMQNFDPTNIEVTPAGAQWFEAGIPALQETHPFVCTYDDPITGIKKLCNTLCETCPCSTPSPAGTELPGGWFWLQNGGPGCANDGTPGTMYGIGSNVANVNFCLFLTVKEFASMTECAQAGDLDFKIQTFSDGVTGCWEDPVGECLKDVPLLTTYEIECDLPPRVLATPNPVEICHNGQLAINVSTEDGSNLEIQVTVEDNPNVDGENDHTFTGTGVIDDILTNTSGSDQIVKYYLRAIDPDIVCPGPLDSVEVLIHSQIIIDFTDFFICDGECTDVAPNSVIGGTGNYVSYVWNNGATGPSINVCPNTPTTYVLLVTDDFGCTGSEQIEVDVKPKPEANFLEDPVSICQQDLEPTLIPVDVTTGSPNYAFSWSVSGTGLNGYISFSSRNYIGDTYEVDGGNSFSTLFSPYTICVDVDDQFGCSDTACMELFVFGSPVGELNTTEPLVCGQTTVDLITSYSSGMASISPLDHFELYDCDGNFIIDGYNEVTIWEDFDLADNDCFILLTFNGDGCIDSDTLQLQTTTGTQATVSGTSPICRGTSSTISVTNAASFSTFVWSNGDMTSSLTVTPDSTRTYTVTVTDANGCTDVETFQVVVNALPVISVSGSTTFCTGSSTSLSASTLRPGATYVWTDAGGTTLSTTANVSITSAGTYTVTATINGCSSQQMVTVTEDSNLNVTLNNPSLCDNNPDTLRAGEGFAMYQWTYNNTILPDTTSTLAIIQAGTYTVSITDITGCSGVDTVEIQNFTTPMAIVTDSITVCRDDNGVGSVTIDFTAQVSGATGTWADTDGSGVDLTDLTNVSFEGIARDTYSFTFTTNTAMGNCDNVSYVMEVIVIRCPCPSVATRPIDDQCNDGGSPLDLDSYLTNPATQIGTWSYISGPTTLTINNSMIDLTNVTPGTYTVQWTIANPVGNCPTADTQSFEVLLAPMAEVLPGNVILCNQSSTQGDLTIDLNTRLVAGSSSGEWTQTSGPAVDLSNLPIISGDGLAPGDELVFTYTTDNATSPCENVSVDVTVRIRDCSCPFVEIAPLPDLCNSGAVINLNDYLTTTPANLAGNWTTNATPNPITGSNFNSAGLLSGQYTVTFTLAVDPGASCDREFTQTINIRRQPMVTVLNNATACSINASGNDSTAVNLFRLINNNPPIGTWSQTSGSPTLPIAANGRVDFDGLPIGSVFTFSYITTGAVSPCINDTATVTVEVIDCNCPNAATLAPSPMCNDDLTLDLASLETADIGTGNWSVTGPNGSLGITGKILTVTGLDEGNYTLTYTLSPVPPGNCPRSSSQTLVISAYKTADVAPNAVGCNVDLGNDENILDLTTIIRSGFGGGTWTGPSGTIFVPTNYDLTNFAIGDIIRLTYSIDNNDPCQDEEYMVDVEILDCTCPPIIVQDFETCSNAGVIDLSPYGDQNQAGSFNSSTLNVIGGNQVDVTGLSGNYTLVYRINNPEPDCPDTASLVMTVIKDLNPGIASDTTLCVGDMATITLADLLEGEDAGGIWTETSNQPSTGAAFNAIQGTFNTNNQSTGTYRFTYTHSGNAPCPTNRSEVSIILRNIPPVDAGAAVTLDCNIDQVTIGGTAGNPNFTYEWSHNGGREVPGGDQATTQVNFPGIFTLIVTDNSTGCQSSDQVIVELSTDRPSAEVTSTNITCFGDADGVIRIVNPVSGTPPYEYSINNGASFTGNPLFENLSPGNYAVLIRDANGCVIELGDVTLMEPNDLSLVLGNPSQLVKLDDTITLNIADQVDLSRITNIVWTITRDGGDSILCIGLNCLSYIYRASNEGLICATITDDNGCSASDCVQINVFKVRTINFPQIFNPGSTNNGSFYVNDDDVEEIEQFDIFDRWGNKVFSTRNTPPNEPSFGWNGTLNGKIAEQGVYVYSIRIRFKGVEQDVEVFTGDITLVR